MKRATTLLLLVGLASMMSIASPLSGHQIFDEDVIVLKNGRRISGRFVVVNDEYVVIKKGNTEMTFPRTAVRAPDRTCLADARLAIADGNYDRAKELCRKYLIWFPQDQEANDILNSTDTAQLERQTREAATLREAAAEALRIKTEEEARLKAAELERLGLPEPATNAVAAPPAGPDDPDVDDVDPIIIEENAKKITGTYYFKGLRLMDIREDGIEAYTELFGETADIAVLTSDSMFAQFLIDKMSEHRGQLTGNRQLVFPEFPFTQEGLFQQMGLTPATDPQIQELRSQLQGDLTSRLAFDAQAKYYERWRLVEGGRLQIDSSLPTFFPSAIQDIEGIRSIVQKTMEGELLGTGDHKRISGWKIVDPREKQGWEELDKANYTQAAALFNAAAKSQPTRPFPLIGETLARIGAQDFTRAKAALKVAAARLNAETGPCLAMYLTMIEDQLYSHESMSMSQDLPAFVDEMAKAPLLINWPLELKPATELVDDELQAIEDLVGRFLHWEKVETAVNETRGRGPLLPLNHSMFLFAPRLEAKLANAQILQNLSTFMILKGHQARQTKQDYVAALKEYASAIALGQKFRHGPMEFRLNGTLLEQAGITAMSELIEDGLLANQETLDAFTQHADQLIATEPSNENHEEICYNKAYPSPMSAPLYELNFLVGIATDSTATFELTANFTLAELHLLKAVAIVKSQHLTGPYPEYFDVSQFPDDPFQQGGKLKYRGGEDGAVLYSVGPDGIDDQGQTKYDPGNGLVSFGDITITLN